MKKAIFNLAVVMSVLAGQAAFNLVSGSARFETGSQPQKKEQTVKVVVKSDGKLIEKDTVIVTKTGTAMSYSAGSVTSVKDTIILSGEGKEKGKRVMIYMNEAKGHPGKDSVTVNCFYIAGDSLQKSVHPDILSPDRIKRMVIMHDGSGPNFDMAGPHQDMVKTRGITMHDQFAFDASDPDIVSYKKQDIGKGQEKITIIRKKKAPKEEVKEIEVKVVK